MRTADDLAHFKTFSFVVIRYDGNSVQLMNYICIVACWLFMPAAMLGILLSSSVLKLYTTYKVFVSMWIFGTSRTDFKMYSLAASTVHSYIDLFPNLWNIMFWFSFLLRWKQQIFSFVFSLTILCAKLNHHFLVNSATTGSYQSYMHVNIYSDLFTMASVLNLLNYEYHIPVDIRLNF